MILFPRKVDQSVFDAMPANSLVVSSDQYFLGFDVTSSTLPITNIQDDDIAKVARFLKTDRSKTWFSVSPEAAVDAVAIVNHNLPAGAKWRVKSSLPVFYQPGTQVLYPTSVDSSSNYTTPLATQVDEDPDDDSDTTSHTITSAGTATSVRYGFATPTYAPATGADLQQFRVRVGLNTAGSVTLTVKLYESNVLVSTLGTATIDALASSGGEAHSFYWDSSLLGTSSGANVQMQVEMTGVGSISGTVLGAAWYVDWPDSTGYDSGWLDVYPGGYDPAEFGLPRVLMHQLDAQSPASAPIFVHLWPDAAGDTPPTSVDVGRMIAGRSITPSTYAFGHAIDTDVELNDDTEIVRTRDGQTRALQRARYLRHQIRLPGLTRSEKNSILADLAAIGHGGELCMYVDTVSTGFYENLYGRFSGMRMRALAPDLWEVTFDLEQRVSDDGS